MEDRIAIAVDGPQPAAGTRDQGQSVSGGGELDLFQCGVLSRLGRLDDEDLSVALGRGRQLEINSVENVRVSSC